jgi:hypothetical protein
MNDTTSDSGCFSVLSSNHHELREREFCKIARLGSLDTFPFLTTRL